MNDSISALEYIGVISDGSLDFSYWGTWFMLVAVVFGVTFASYYAGKDDLTKVGTVLLAFVSALGTAIGSGVIVNMVSFHPAASIAIVVVSGFSIAVSEIGSRRK